jgi:two-component system cell cycle response regulator
LKVLIAEDDPVSRLLLSRLLVKEGYEVVAANNGLEAWEALRKEGAPRLALLDWMMPGMEGPAVCKRVRQSVGGTYTYILLLTSKDATPDLVEGFESGADDYLTKPLNPEELKARLRAGLRILRLEDDLVAAREEMQFKATHDALTGLWNRGAILDMLQRDTARARRELSSVTILLCDIDHFKSVNDTHGHAVGDDVLREGAKRFLESIREYDAAGRYGGEEFLILLPGCPSLKTPQRAEQVRLAFSAHPFNTAAGPLDVTVSIGAVSTGEWNSASTEELIRLADDALYRAKKQGRNRSEVASPGSVIQNETPTETHLVDHPARSK